jgi:CheY-like chemotaxis protein
MRVLSVGEDLLFFSRIRAEAIACGLSVSQARNATELATALNSTDEVQLILLDLDAMDASAVVEASAGRAPVLAYGPHVQADLLRQAREAGCTRVVPRSVFVKELQEILMGAKSC